MGGGRGGGWGEGGAAPAATVPGARTLRTHSRHQKRKKKEKKVCPEQCGRPPILYGTPSLVAPRATAVTIIARGGRGAGVGGRGAGAPARWRPPRRFLGACWGRAAQMGQQGPVKSRETGTQGLRSVRPCRAFGGAHEGHVQGPRAQQTATPPPAPHPWSGWCAIGSPVEASPAPSPRRSQRWGAWYSSRRACLWSALWQPRASLFSRGSFPDQVLRVHASKARTRRRAPSPPGLHPPPPRDAQSAPARAPGCWSVSPADCGGRPDGIGSGGRSATQTGDRLPQIPAPPLRGNV